MRCPVCGFENASGIKFCGECCEPLKIRCSSCGFGNAPGIKCSGERGKPLAEAAKPSNLSENDPQLNARGVTRRAASCSSALNSSYP